MNTIYSAIGDNTETDPHPLAWVPAGLAVFAVFCLLVWLVVSAVGRLL